MPQRGEWTGEREGREQLVLGAAILLTAVLALLSVRVGELPLSTGQILDIPSGGQAGTTPAHVLWSSRLPRVGWVCWRAGRWAWPAASIRPCSAIPWPLPT